MTSFRQQLIQENVEQSGRLEEWQLQYLVDEVARLLGMKEKYEAKFCGRLRRHDARAHTSHFVMKGRRLIEFNEYSTNDSWLWFRHSYINKTNSDGTVSNEKDLEKTRRMRRQGLIKTIVHEIAHFKRVQRERRQYRNGTHNSWKRRHHVKAFFDLVEKLWQELQPHLDYLIDLDLSKAPKPQQKPEPTKNEIATKKLTQIQNHIKKLNSRIKRLSTQLRKWKARERYYQKVVNP